MKQTDRSKYLSLLRSCKDKGYTVKLVKTGVLKDYAGMNDEVAKRIGFKHNGKKLKDKTILLDINLPVQRKIKDLKHEVVEMNLMEKTKIPYWNAHLKALKAEKGRNVHKI